MSEPGGGSARMARRPLMVTAPGAAWRGLFLDVDGPVVPTLRVEVAPGRRLRIVQGDRTLLWARVAADYYGVDVVADAAIEPVLPPLSTADARTVAGAGDESRLERWAHRFLDLLSARSHPLHRGHWVIEDATRRVDWHRALVDRVVPVGGAKPTWVEWDIGDPPHLLPLRPLSSVTDGRVKALTKLALDGSLPPVLLWWVSGLDSYVIIDGHDRFLAASRAGVTTPILALSGVLGPDDARAAARRSDVDEQEDLDDAVREHPDQVALHEARAAAVVRAIARQESMPRTRAWFSAARPSAWPIADVG